MYRSKITESNMDEVVIFFLDLLDFLCPSFVFSDGKRIPNKAKEASPRNYVHFYVIYHFKVS